MRGRDYYCYGLHSRTVRKGVRAQTHNAGKTRFIIIQGKHTRHENTAKEKGNWWATPPVGHPPGRPPLR